MCLLASVDMKQFIAGSYQEIVYITMLYYTIKDQGNFNLPLPNPYQNVIDASEYTKAKEKDFIRLHPKYKNVRAHTFELGSQSFDMR